MICLCLSFLAVQWLRFAISRDHVLPDTHGGEPDDKLVSHMGHDVALLFVSGVVASALCAIVAAVNVSVKSKNISRAMHLLELQLAMITSWRASAAPHPPHPAHHPCPQPRPHPQHTAHTTCTHPAPPSPLPPPPPLTVPTRPTRQVLLLRRHVDDGGDRPRRDARGVRGLRAAQGASHRPHRPHLPHRPHRCLRLTRATRLASYAR